MKKEFSALQIEREEQQPEETKTVIKSIDPKFIDYLNTFNNKIRICKKKVEFRTNYEEDSKTDSESERDGLRKERSVKRNRQKEKDYKVIIGEKKNGKVNGEAVLEMRNGAIFKGTVVDGELKTGVMTFKSGIQYQGGFSEGLFNGEGMLIMINGSKICSNWSNGKMHNNGTIIYGNGDKYIGHIQHLKKHGYGEIKLKNGCTYVGEFFNGEISGYGVYSRGSHIIAEGVWKDGVFLGLVSEDSESFQK